MTPSILQKYQSTLYLLKRTCPSIAVLSGIVAEVTSPLTNLLEPPELKIPAPPLIYDIKIEIELHITVDDEEDSSTEVKAINYDT